MTHIVLLGDSVFDNGAYVNGGPDVVRQLRGYLPNGTATLCAVDGATTRSVPGQTQRVPADATHLVVSIGGNDALGHIGVLDASAHSVANALNRLAGIGNEFERNYHAMLTAVLARHLPTALCTIYNPRFPDAGLQRLATTALTLFNDVIIRSAFAAGLPLLDLRLICASDEDFANPIEPSAVGGAKIASAIQRAMATHDFSKGRTEVFVR
jgi:lysophospholipase L1-like esterase